MSRTIEQTMRSLISEGIETLKNHSHADRIKAFGSVGRDSPNPGDLDVVVDLRDQRYSPEATKPFQDLLKMSHSSCRKMAGWFDPFLWFEDQLLVRSPEGTHWQKAQRSASITRAIEEDGRPILDINFPAFVAPSTRPSTPVERRVMEWALTGDTGASSLALARRMMGLESSESPHPQDCQDLLRCVQLLDAVPEFRQNLDKMASLSPAWAGLVHQWPTLEASLRSEMTGSRLYPDETKGTYALMRSAIAVGHERYQNNAEDTSPGPGL